MNGHALRAVVAVQKSPYHSRICCLDTPGQRRTMRHVVIIEYVGAHARSLRCA
ncbi:hypothetical protein D3C77_115110 [compost metagenome]